MTKRTSIYQLIFGGVLVLLGLGQASIGSPLTLAQILVGIAFLVSGASPFLPEATMQKAARIVSFLICLVALGFFVAYFL